jgi:hypothetical protein
MCGVKLVYHDDRILLLLGVSHLLAFKPPAEMYASVELVGACGSL